MSVRILTGDVRDMLATLPDESVHCVVTSPPYWGLRDYGIDGQIGMEPTMGEHIETMVAVFRDVRRVLRKDGTVWLNYGSNYISGETATNQSRQIRNAPACDSDGTAPSNSPGSDCAYPDPCDERQADFLNHHAHNSDNGQRHRRAVLPHALTIHGNEHSGSSPTSPDASPRAFQGSSNPASSHCALGADDRAATVSADQITGPTFADDDQPFARRDGCTNGTSEIQRLLAAHNWDKEPLALACLYLSIASRQWKAKDLANVANLIAEALQCDGWWVRKEIIWHKSNPMPESATDRPTSSHEKVWLLARSGETVFWTHRDGAGTRSQPAPDHRWVHKQSGEERTDDPGDPDTWKRINLWRGRDYFYDAEAVKTPAVATTAKMPDGWDTGPGAHGSIHRNGREKGKKAARGQPPRHSQYDTGHQTLDETPRGNGANLRDVWTIATAPFRGAHYATFPPDLVVLCIKAGTSEKGCCAECGAPWVRDTEAVFLRSGRARSNITGQANMQGWEGIPRGSNRTSTLGWSPSCACDATTIPCTVLDPFIGSGTTAMVADRLGRDCIGIDLNPANVEMSVGRVKDDAGLFAEVATP